MLGIKMPLISVFKDDDNLYNVKDKGMHKYIIWEAAECRLANHIIARSPKEAEAKFARGEIQECELVDIIESHQVDETELND